MPTIPTALQFMFGPDEIPWAPLPDVGETPTVDSVNRIDFDSHLTIQADEIFYANETERSLINFSNLINIVNHGLVWIQSSTQDVSAINGGNSNIVINYGDVVALSETDAARGYAAWSWGLLKNYGTIKAVSNEFGASGYGTYSRHAWSGDTENINAGTIEAWSGAFNATAVVFRNGADSFTNSGTLQSRGYLEAAGVYVPEGNFSLSNSGLIDVDSYTDGRAFAIWINSGNSKTFNIDNSGTIRGDNAIFIAPYTKGVLFSNINNTSTGLIEGAITSFLTRDTLTNAGIIDGDVDLGSGDDFLDNSLGVIRGSISLGGRKIDYFKGDDDVFLGGDEGETVEGGQGNDSISGGNGADMLYGEWDDDSLSGQSDTDYLSGGGGADTLDGGAGNDTLVGWTGNDSLSGGNDNDHLFGNDGIDTLRGDAGDDKLFGMSGNDRLFGGGGNDSLFGNANADRLEGGAGQDALRGLGGNDRLFGGDGMDSLLGHTGNDIINGGNQSDILDGGAGNDQLFGDAGNDTLFGREGNDTIKGGSGADVVLGSTGADRITGGAGADMLTGNGGNDFYFYETGDDADTITDFQAGAGSQDVINLSAIGASFDTFAEVQAAASDDGLGNTVIDFGGGDTITLTGIAAASLHQDDFVFV